MKKMLSLAAIAALGLASAGVARAEDFGAADMKALSAGAKAMPSAAAVELKPAAKADAAVDAALYNVEYTRWYQHRRDAEYALSRLVSSLRFDGYIVLGTHIESTRYRHDTVHRGVVRYRGYRRPYRRPYPY